MKDIYYKMNSSLACNGYFEADIMDKKRLVEEQLKKYTISKILEIAESKVISNDLDMNELIDLLGQLIPKNQHFDTLRHFTHYILQVVENFQGWAITWWVEDDIELIKQPLLKINEQGLWVDLITHEDTDYVQTFKFVFDLFNNNFMKEQSFNNKLLINRF